MTDSKAGQARCLEIGFREPVARGPTKKQSVGGEGEESAEQ